MNLFGIFGKKGENSAAGKAKGSSDLKALEIYSGMRVVVEDLEGQVLFIAKLQDPQGDTAGLHQYSDTEVVQDADTEALGDKEPVHVKLRGYNDHKRTAVFMEGSISPKQKHIWQVEDLVITEVENERSFSRFDTDVDAVITMPGSGDGEEVHCKLQNISVGGAGLCSEHRYHKGDRFLLKVKLLEDKPAVTLYCEVLRVIEKGPDRFEYGCQFLELTEASQKEITQEIREIAERA